MANCIDELILHFGGRAAFAKALGVNLSTIWRWRTSMPYGRAYQIEILTNGKFKAQDLIAGISRYQ